MAKTRANAKVIRMEDIVAAKSTDTEPKEPQNTTKSKKPKTTNDAPKGRPKSGRFWKSEKKKFSSIIKTKGVKSSFERKEKLREDLRKIKEASNELKEKKKQDEEAKKQRRRDNLKRQEENRKKSEVVQVITNTKKLKRMKKKQLRYIEKRDTTQVQK